MAGWRACGVAGCRACAVSGLRGAGWRGGGLAEWRLPVRASGALRAERRTLARRCPRSRDDRTIASATEVESRPAMICDRGSSATEDHSQPRSRGFYPAVRWKSALPAAWPDEPGVDREQDSASCSAESARSPRALWLARWRRVAAVRNSPITSRKGGQRAQGVAMRRRGGNPMRHGLGERHFMELPPVDPVDDRPRDPVVSPCDLLRAHAMSGDLGSPTTERRGVQSLRIATSRVPSGCTSPHRAEVDGLRYEQTSGPTWSGPSAARSGGTPASSREEHRAPRRMEEHPDGLSMR